MSAFGIRHVYACRCRTETECDSRDLRLGAVVACPQCGEVSAHVRTRDGRGVWIHVAEPDVEFHDLLRKPEEDDA